VEGEKGMGSYLNRRNFLIGAGVGAVGAAATVGASTTAVFAADESDGEGIEGGWYIKIHITTSNAPPPIDQGSRFAGVASNPTEATNPRHRGTNSYRSV